MTTARLLRAARWILVGLFFVGVPVSTLWGSPADRTSFILIPILVYTVIGALVTARQPRNPIGWLFLLVGGFTGLGAFSDAAMVHALNAGNPSSWEGVWGGWIQLWFWFPLFSSATLFTVMLFPGGLLSRRWRPLLWISLAGVGALTALGAMSPTIEVGYSEPPPCTPPRQLSDTMCKVQVANPVSPGGFGELVGAVIIVTLVGALLVCLILAVVTAVIRTKRADGIQRQQMRWFAFSATVLLVWLVFSSFLHGDPVWSEVVFALALGLIPLSCGLAILRYHLYDIDRIISRTASYAVVTTLLIGTYLLLVWLMSELFGVLVAGTGGSRHPSSVIVAAATLTAAALARPLLRRVQAVIDRRFDRTRYDGQRAVAEFGSRLRHEVDVAVVSQDLVASVKHTLAPEQVSLWIRETP